MMECEKGEIDKDVSDILESRFLPDSEVRRDTTVTMEAEVTKCKEKLSKFDDVTKELLKSLEKYQDACKVMCEAESQLMRDLEKFYSIDGKLKGGIEEAACEFSEHSLHETKVINSLSDTLKMNTKKTKVDYDATFQIFKKRFGDSSETERASAVDDFSCWEEQKYDFLDPLFLLLLKIRASRKTLRPELIERTWIAANVPPIQDPDVVLSTLSNLISNPFGVLYFRAFLSTEFSTENLDLILEVIEFRKISEKPKMIQQALHIYETFFHEKGEKQVNISFDQLKRIKSIMEHPDLISSACFDACYTAVWSLVENDSFPRFLKHPLATRLIKRLTKKDFVNFNRRRTRNSRSSSEPEPFGSPIISSDDDERPKTTESIKSRKSNLLDLRKPSFLSRRRSLAVQSFGSSGSESEEAVTTRDALLLANTAIRPNKSLSSLGNLSAPSSPSGESFLGKNFPH